MTHWTVFDAACSAAEERTGTPYELPIEIDFATQIRVPGTFPLDVIADTVAWFLAIGYKVQGEVAEQARSPEKLDEWRKSLEPETQVAVDRWLEIHAKEQAREEQWKAQEAKRIKRAKKAAAQSLFLRQQEKDAAKEIVEELIDSVPRTVQRDEIGRAHV